MNSFSNRGDWVQKFRDAIAGVRCAATQENSFWVHLPTAAAVLAAGWWVEVDRNSFALLIVCCGLVIVCELFNSSVERIAQSVTSQHDPLIRDALDIASGAVLVAAITAAITGAIVLVPPIVQFALG